MIKKVVVSADKKEKAIAFFDELARKKEETVKRIEAKTASVRELIKRRAVAK
jgi:hypothetical protein